MYIYNIHIYTYTFTYLYIIGISVVCCLIAEGWTVSAKCLSCPGRHIPRVLQLGTSHVPRHIGQCLYLLPFAVLLRVKST